MPYTDYNQVLQDLADNIREVNGTTAPIRFVNMPDLIDAFISPSISLYGETGSTWKRKLIPYIGDTSGMTDMHNMFKDLDQRNYPLDLSQFDTSNVTNMSHMFDRTFVSSLDLSSFDTSNVTDISYMFSELWVSTSGDLDISHFNTSKVTNMRYTFFNLGYPSTASVTLDVTGWDVSKVTDFTGCFAVDPYHTFSGIGITELDLSDWDTSKASAMNNMFGGTYLRKIWVPSTFVATRCPSNSKPFGVQPRNTCHIYTDASSASAQGWGTIVSPFTVHYNSTHADYENA